MSDSVDGSPGATRRRKLKRVSLLVGIAATVVPIAACVVLMIVFNVFPGAQEVPPERSSWTPLPTPTRRPTSTPRPTPTPVPTPQGLPAGRALGDTWVRPADGALMVYVPGGTFVMGGIEDDPEVQRDELPAHEVTLSGYWIDQTEVTNAQYARCVEAGVCPEPFVPLLESFEDYYGNPAYDDYPVIYVSWVLARTYCGWVSAQLPSEAQWEYAARGPEGSIYPWGNVPPDEMRANYGQEVNFTTRVGSYPEGASWCSALDMAGNVWEWTGDWFFVYSPEAQTDPVALRQGVGHVLRGGSWYDGAAFIRSTNRYLLSESQRDYIIYSGNAFNVGFRCAVRP